MYLVHGLSVRLREGSALDHAGDQFATLLGITASQVELWIQPLVRGDDPLLAIAPDVYVRRLLGVEVPRHRKVPCPFHEDRHASLHVYDTAERGWYCFGACRRGGTIYDLAAPLCGYTARGEDFLRLRAELLGEPADRGPLATVTPRRRQDAPRAR